MLKRDEETLADLKGTLSGMQNYVKVLQTNIERPEVLERFIKQRKKAIATLQKQLADLENQRDNGPELLREAKKSVRGLKKKVKILEHKKKVERLLKLQADIAAIENSM